MAGRDHTAGSSAASELRAGRLDIRQWGSDQVQLALSVVTILLMILLPAWAGSGYWTYVFQVVCLYVTVSSFQNMLLIDAGQMSFGQGAIFGLAAYTAGS